MNESCWKESINYINCSNKYNGFGKIMCKLYENVNYYELEIDVELGYEDEDFFWFL